MERPMSIKDKCRHKFDRILRKFVIYCIKYVGLSRMSKLIERSANMLVWFIVWAVVMFISVGIMYSVERIDYEQYMDKHTPIYLPPNYSLSGSFCDNEGNLNLILTQMNPGCMPKKHYIKVGDTLRTILECRSRRKHVDDHDAIFSTRR